MAKDKRAGATGRKVATQVAKAVEPVVLQVINENLQPLLDLMKADPRVQVILVTEGESGTVTNQIHSVKLETPDGEKVAEVGHWIILSPEDVWLTQAESPVPAVDEAEIRKWDGVKDDVIKALLDEHEAEIELLSGDVEPDSREAAIALLVRAGVPVPAPEPARAYAPPAAAPAAAATTADPKPSIGRIVHYRHRGIADDAGTERVLPAIVLDAGADGRCTLKVIDEGSDFAKYRVEKHPEKVGCWFWPPRS